MNSITKCLLGFCDDAPLALRGPLPWRPFFRSMLEEQDSIIWRIMLEERPPRQWPAERHSIFLQAPKFLAQDAPFPGSFANYNPSFPDKPTPSPRKLHRRPWHPLWRRHVRRAHASHQKMSCYSVRTLRIPRTSRWLHHSLYPSLYRCESRARNGTER